jgi:hypothetical protein
MTATVYFQFGRLLRASGRRLGCLPARLVGRVFLIADVVTFIIQAGGGGQTASTNASMRDMGAKTVLLGLGVQIVVFTLFAVGLVVATTQRSYRLCNVAALKPVYRVMYAVTLLIYVRSLYRVVEYTGMVTGGVHQSEVRGAWRAAWARAIAWPHATQANGFEFASSGRIDSIALCRRASRATPRPSRCVQPPPGPCSLSSRSARLCPSWRLFSS